MRASPDRSGDPGVWRALVRVAMDAQTRTTVSPQYTQRETPCPMIGHGAWRASSLLQELSRSRFDGSRIGQTAEQPVIVAPALLELPRERIGRIDDEVRAVAADQAFTHEPTEHERYGFARGADQLAEQPIACGAEHDLSRLRREGRVLRHAQHRRDQTLLDTQGGQLAKLLEQHAALGHDLTDDRECMMRLFAEEGTETCTAEVQGLSFFIGARIGGVRTARGEPFGAETLARCCDPWNVAASGPDSASKDDASANDEEQIGRAH